MLSVGDWVMLDDGTRGQVWSDAPGGYWVAVHDDLAGKSRWAEVSLDGRELGYSVMGRSK